MPTTSRLIKVGTIAGLQTAYAAGCPNGCCCNTTKSNSSAIKSTVTNSTVVSGSEVEEFQKFDSPYQFEPTDYDDVNFKHVYPPLHSLFEEFYNGVVTESAFLVKDIVLFSLLETMNLVNKTAVQVRDFSVEQFTVGLQKSGVYERYDELLASNPQYVAVREDVLSKYEALKDEVVANPAFVSSQEYYELVKSESVKHYTHAKTVTGEKYDEIKIKVSELDFSKFRDEVVYHNYTIFTEKYYSPVMQQYVTPHLATIIRVFEKENPQHCGKFDEIQKALETNPHELFWLILLVCFFMRVIRFGLSFLPAFVPGFVWVFFSPCPCCWYYGLLPIVAPVVRCCWAPSNKCTKGKCCGPTPSKTTVDSKKGDIKKQATKSAAKAGKK